MALSFKYHQLPNGLDIVAEINPDSYSFAAGLFVKTGSRDEDPSIVGVSHFLEHMMFKGSIKYGWEDVNRIFDEMGARYNAFTSQEMTAYYATFCRNSPRNRWNISRTCSAPPFVRKISTPRKKSFSKKSRCISTIPAIAFMKG
jgi:hypothetical protein